MHVFASKVSADRRHLCNTDIAIGALLLHVRRALECCAPKHSSPSCGGRRIWIYYRLYLLSSAATFLLLFSHPDFLEPNCMLPV